jgi:hypothetical protein
VLKNIIAIGNFGRFQNSASGGDTDFGEQIFDHGANDHGKTTICAILRSSKTGAAGSRAAASHRVSQRSRPGFPLSRRAPAGGPLAGSNRCTAAGILTLLRGHFFLWICKR